MAAEKDKDALTFIDRNTAVLSLDPRLCRRLQGGASRDESDSEVEELMSQFLMALRQLSDVKLN